MDAAPRQPPALGFAAFLGALSPLLRGALLPSVTFRVSTSTLGRSEHQKPCSDTSLICAENITSYSPRNSLKSFTNKQVRTGRPQQSGLTCLSNCVFLSLLTYPLLPLLLERLSGALGWEGIISLKSLKSLQSRAQLLPSLPQPLCPWLGVDGCTLASQLLCVELGPWEPLGAFGGGEFAAKQSVSLNPLPTHHLLLPLICHIHPEVGIRKRHSLAVYVSVIFSSPPLFSRLPALAPSKSSLARGSVWKLGRSR